ncbi:hypothetical protein A440_2551 [Listeria monocytogenes serotype 1/2c str. 10-5025]|nr:hypothetical protein LM5578_2639 [Listeria monocytogenes 08-5578]ADB72429.1 hypothetical protein LM5923_2588 [Listeria monocytogenes 08-5923]AHF33302.1 hypothetical protein A430_2677 [Listeria monocytogenes serotype 1/2a str. 08-6569]AHF36293.1 hypothetical protein A431_2677 [Listeria monocytogenes serotype 1/2a str. 08-6997]AHF39284.1 hypothetical protein A435_2677 [Listeria monocytogenes serotype 1/2a str. 10-0815]AHF42225.1 hypothetical protein A437_2627 [Listeria monocytogenes serotype 
MIQAALLSCLHHFFIWVLNDGVKKTITILE